MTIIAHHALSHPQASHSIALSQVDSLDHRLALHEKEVALLELRKTQESKLAFIAGRLAAQEALRSCRSDGPVLSVSSSTTQRDPPLWPDSFRGSIAHTSHTVGAMTGVAVVSNAQCSLGIDVEKIDVSISPAAQRKIITEQERALHSTALDSPHNVLKLFCVKEALYKALWPLYQAPLYFKDAYLDQDFSTIRLAERLREHQAIGPRVYHATFYTYNNLLITIVSDDAV